MDLKLRAEAVALLMLAYSMEQCYYCLHETKRECGRAGGATAAGGMPVG
jgi:hypothetical protein